MFKKKKNKYSTRSHISCRGISFKEEKPFQIHMLTGIHLQRSIKAASSFERPFQGAFIPTREMHPTRADLAQAESCTWRA